MPPGTSAHALPAELQRRHCALMRIGAIPRHVPVRAVRIWPSVAVPPTAGAAATVGEAGSTRMRRRETRHAAAGMTDGRAFAPAQAMSQ